MTPRSRSRYTPLPRALTIASLGLVVLHAAAGAQTRWTVDRRASLAWWQVNPHLNHLWATTCPQDPTWRPGEGRSGGWLINPGLKPPKEGYAGTLTDSSRIPLYPRLRVMPLCSEAVRGYVDLPDTVSWQGVRGEIVVLADELVGGEKRRDEYARSAVLTTNRHPEITFRIDSVVNVSRNLDTLRGTATGTFTLRTVETKVTAGVRTWPVAGGHRVLARFHIPAQNLVTEYGISKFALGLGIGASIWQDLWLGVDLLMREEKGASGAGTGGSDPSP
jgi:hypothetical protein